MLGISANVLDLISLRNYNHGGIGSFSMDCIYLDPLLNSGVENNGCYSIGINHFLGVERTWYIFQPESQKMRAAC
jgi:hypothetical protein